MVLDSMLIIMHIKCLINRYEKFMLGMKTTDVKKKGSELSG